jgi:hypothetical protein
VDTDIAASSSPAHAEQRRTPRFKLDVPLRIILHKIEATLVRQGRGTELNDNGLCVLVGVELAVGDLVKIEFTLPYSGEPIRVSGTVRNRQGYRYGCEFSPEGQEEREAVARLRQVLQTFAEEKVAE